MPRTKKPAGQTVDKRNGRKAELQAVAEPARIDPPAELCDEARAQWDAYWADAAAMVQTPADRGVVLRWIDAVDRYLRLMGEADKKPIVPGSTGQPTVNPLYKIADKAHSTILACERQLGIGALNRAGLGIAVLSEQRSLQDMNARYGGGDVGDGDEATEDPRLTVIEGDLA